MFETIDTVDIDHLTQLLSEKGIPLKTALIVSHYERKLDKEEKKLARKLKIEIEEAKVRTENIF